MAEEKQVGFVAMGRAGGGAEVQEIGVGMLAYTFMGKAHSNAYRKIYGYRAAEVCDAVVRSSESGRREEIAYR